MEKYMLIYSVLLILCIYSAKISKRFNIPLLIIFIFIGMAVGSDGMGWIYYDDHNSAYIIATISLCVILFTGGLESKISNIKPIIKEGLSLSIVGVFLSVIFFAFPIHYLANLDWALAFLASATVASTDAAAVFSLLEFSGLNLKPSIKSLIEFESGSNDPIAYVMVILFMTLVSGEHASILHYIYFFLREILIGLFAGLLLGYLAEKFIAKLKLQIDALYPILLLGILGLTYACTQLLHGNGYLAIYVLGISIGSKKFIYKESSIRFFSIMSWIMQIVMFLCLGLLVFPREVSKFAIVGLLLAIIMMFIVRPASVFISLIPFRKKYDIKSKIFISAGGFKGAVAIVFATFTMVNDVPHSDIIFNLIFFIVLVSVITQGKTLNFLAKKLGMTIDK